uniref:Protein kinase domain-containing protein n=1 Tax=Acrobeloides nanus TaxID=290746 RepID=A0A914EAB5_9BILA
MKVQLKSYHHKLSVVGTSIYIAPEVYTQNYDVKADLWSVGVTMLKCVAGGVPNFNSKTWINTRHIWTKK